MVKRKKLIESAMTAFLALAATQTAYAVSNQPTLDPTEKCYGIVKAGMNDCATAKSDCAGSATKDRQADAFIFMPKSACEKIVGGHLESEKKPIN